MEDKIRVLIEQEKLEKRIYELAAQISKDYEGRELHLICILKGSVFFTCELAKYITIPVTLDFIEMSSYGDGTISKGTINVTKDTNESIEGKDVLLVEDIIDTGYTLSFLLNMMKARKPSSLKLCTLLDKPDRRETKVEVDYKGFEIPDEFAVGYGLDYSQKYRNLPYIGVIDIKED